MNFKYFLIGLMLVLALCISPVAAVSADDFEILVSVSDKNNGYDTYAYLNVNDPYEKYIHIHTPGTIWMLSAVTFKPHNIPDAPVMVVDTHGSRDIYLPYSVDEWEIKYYSSDWSLVRIDDECLKNEGVLNFKQIFHKYLSYVLKMELRIDTWIYVCYLEYVGNNCYSRAIIWAIPDVD